MTIKNAIEEQITWLESNLDATINQLKIHKTYLEDIVTSVTDKLEKEIHGQKKPPRSSDNYNNDLW